MNNASGKKVWPGSADAGRSPAVRYAIGGLNLLLLSAIFLSQPVFAQGDAAQTKAAQSLTRSKESGPGANNLSGVWELWFDSKNVPPASLTPEIAAEDRSVQYNRDMAATRWCHFFGTPYAMEQSPIEILQNRNGKEVVITFPVRSPARHIYTDGRGHVNPDIFDAVSNGHSIGHWEGDTLVVDTVGFSDEGITGIPGGGRRTTTSHLVERYRLLGKGDRLSVTFTWDDPKIFARPHSYEFRYYRAPKGIEVREYDCKASDEERAGFLLGAAGK
jgi:hypothetical protein